MKFTTKIEIPNSSNPINYHSKIISLGSCFAANMGQKLDYFKFQNTSNPFGIIFNPVSIAQLVSRVVNQKKFTPDDIFFHNERFHCYEVHSDLSSDDEGVFLDRLNAVLALLHQQIKQATHVLITYGTSWVYCQKENQAVVANCHKMPQAHFDKRILDLNVVENAIQNTLANIRQLNSNCAFVFSISPVRHLKDGFVANQRSKALLILALQKLLSEDKLDKASYFPAYEIMMDELRDYRFYDTDLLHPSRLAIDYIWERFRETTICETVFSTLDELATIQKGMLHQAFHPHSASHQKFELKQKERIAIMQKKYPFMRF